MDSVHSRSQANATPSRSEQNHSERLWLPFLREQEGSNLVKTIRPKPWPGQAPGLLFGRTTALPSLSRPLLGCSQGTINSHFKVLMKAPSASKAQGGKHAQHGVESQALCQTLDLGGRGWGMRTHGDTEHSGVATAGGPAGTCVLSPYL